MNTNSKNKQVCTNRQASYNYFIGETFECGIVLAGTEVKSVALSSCSIKDAYVRIEDGEAFVYGFHVTAYEKGNIWNKEEDRPKKLLLHKGEIAKLFGAVKTDGMTIVPTKVYFRDGKAKMEVALCKGKHSYDKRDTIAKRDADKNIRRAIKEYNR